MRVLDGTMCLLWIATYLLVLIGTIKTRYPLIPLQTQAIIAPFEWIVTLNLLLESARINYAVIAYVFWGVLEVAIIIVNILRIHMPPKRIILFLLFMLFMTGAMYDVIINHDGMLFCSYFNTLLGIIIWIGFISKPNYPMVPITLALFITKLTADVIAVPVYFGKGIVLISIMCVMLPIVDVAFICIFCIRRFQKKKSEKLPTFASHR